jgi:anti-anti-sigma factor
MPAIAAQQWRSTPFNVQTRQEEPGTITFGLSGPFTARDMYSCLSPAELRFILESELEDALVHCFDLTAVPYVDAAGIRMIMGHYTRCHARGIHMTLVGPSDRVREAFKLARLEHLCPGILDLHLTPSAV